MNFDTKPYLRSIRLNDDEPLPEGYPFTIPIVQSLEALEFHPDMTILVGENGSGKSTLLEAIAVAWGFNPEGGTINANFSSHDSHSKLSDYLRMSKGFKKPQDGFFLRAESFYTFASYVDEIGYLKGYGGKSLHEQSHGEAFLSMLEHKLRGRGIYIFDEPEAALSPKRQLSAIALMASLVKKESQFIIATHSPILMAYPNAKLVQLGENGLEEVKLEDTEHYQITKSFLDNPDLYLGPLME